MLEIYLDNSATTKPYLEVNAAYLDMTEICYGNPSSLHKLGMRAEKEVKNARATLASILGVREKELFFTSGGTESNNLAILGYARANKRRGMHIITTAVEHPAVAEPIAQLKEEGFDVTVLGVDEHGRIRPEEFDAALREDTILAAVMYVNNEIGAIMPMEKLKPMIKKKSPHCALFVDAVQAFGKIQIKPEKLGIDMMSVSGHKIHGPKGIGLLYVKEKTLIKPILYGGHQQSNLRSGTENTPAIVGLATAAQLAFKDPKKQLKIRAMRDMLKAGILTQIDNVVINSDDDCLENILNVSFIGVRSEVLLHALESKDIYVSSGSACASNAPKPSATLTAMGKNAKEIDSALRFSFSEFNTAMEIQEVIKVLVNEVAELRKYMR